MAHVAFQVNKHTFQTSVRGQAKMAIDANVRAEGCVDRVSLEVEVLVGPNVNNATAIT